MNIQALLLGHNQDAPYHPLDAVSGRLLEILRETAQVEVTTDSTMLQKTSLNRFQLCISYTDSWKEAVGATEAAGLLQFVAEGGGLLVIHNGISLQARPELCQLIGGRFTGHPPYTELSFHVADEPHPILAAAGEFVMEEEPYRFELDPHANLQVLLTYRQDGQDWPAAWTREYGLGRVVFLMPGHHLPSFQHEAYATWIVAGAKWAAGQQG